MILENKPKIETTNYGRVSPDLINCKKLKSFIFRDETLNVKGRQSLKSSPIKYDELFLQVTHSSSKGDIAPQIFLIEITDTGYSRVLLGRFSVKQGEVKPRAIWNKLEGSTIATLAKHYPKLDTLECLDKFMDAAMELLVRLLKYHPDRTAIANRRKHRQLEIIKPKIKQHEVIKPILKEKKKVDHSELVGLIPTERILDSVRAKYNLSIVEKEKYLVSSRVHIKQPDIRQGRF